LFLIFLGVCKKIVDYFVQSSEGRKKKMAEDPLSPSNGKFAESKTNPQRSFSVWSHNKMVLHALKYTARPVLGLLIGYRKTTDRQSFIHIIDAIPLIHNTFSAMVVELAFAQINVWLNEISNRNKSSQKLQIIGAYFANEHNDDTKKLTGAVIICDQLIQQFGENSVVLAQIDNERISSCYKNKDMCVDFYMLRNDGNVNLDKDWKKPEFSLTNSNLYAKWKKMNEKEQIKSYEEYLINFDSSMESCDCKDLNLNVLVDSHKEETLNDFEDHLDNVSKDWRNIHCC